MDDSDEPLFDFVDSSEPLPTSGQPGGSISSLLTASQMPTYQPLPEKQIERTDITSHQVAEQMEGFIAAHQDVCDEEIQYALFSGRRFFNLDCELLASSHEHLYVWLRRFPAQVLEFISVVVNNRAMQLNADVPQSGSVARFKPLVVRPYNVPEHKGMREVGPEDRFSLITVTGMITRVSRIIPRPTQAMFRCAKCSTSVGPIGAIDNEISAPVVCPNCRARHTLYAVDAEGIYDNLRVATLQEPPATVPKGETPITLTLHLQGDLTEAVSPGDYVAVTGIWSLIPQRLAARMRTVKALHKTYLDALHIDRTFRDVIQVSEQSFTVEQEEAFRGFADREGQQVYDDLVASFAPSLHGLEIEKLGLLCMLFGGVIRKHMRSEINILMIGDPGVAKSRLLKYCYDLSARGAYTSGKGSTGVGLTAYVTKDQYGDHVLEAGALVLADMGVCCIDEFDKLPESTKTVLHEAMEQRTISIAKAGIICTLNARCAVVAAANPVESRYNHDLSLTENLNIMPTLLSRFDLIFLMLDQRNQATDRALVRHVAKLFDSESEMLSPPLNKHDLAHYISYCKHTCNPVLTMAAHRRALERYLQMRGYGQSDNRTTATPRQLESAVRIAEALCRMRLKTDIEPPEIDKAFDLMEAAFGRVARDGSGLLDLDVITGTSTMDRQKIKALMGKIQDVLRGQGPMSLADAQNAIRSADTQFVFSERHFADAIASLAREELAFVDGSIVRSNR